MSPTPVNFDWYMYIYKSLKCYSTCKCLRPVGESGNKVNSLQLFSKDVNVSQVAKSICIVSLLTNIRKWCTYIPLLLDHLKLSFCLFGQQSSLLECFSRLLQADLNTLQPAHMHQKYQNRFINIKYSRALYCRQQKAGLSELQVIQNQFHFLRVVQMYTHFSSAFMLGALILWSVDWSRVTWAFRS